MIKNYVVIGSSAASIGAVARLRALDSCARIICVTASVKMPYNKCLLADLVSGERSLEQVSTKGISFFIENSVELYLGAIVIKLDADSKYIVTNSGRTISYDALFVGAGTSVRIPKISGSKLEGVFKFHTLEDTQDICKYISLDKVRRAIVVGAGLSGIECASSLAEKGLTVQLLDLKDHVLFGSVDQDGALLIQSLIKDKGVTFRENVALQSINGENAVRSVSLSNDKKILADIVVFAIGGRPNMEFARDAGVEISDGVCTDSSMRTNLPDVYAGGDVCMVKNRLTGKFVRSCMWPDAMQQGMCAASNIVGVDKQYRGVLPVTSSNFFDTSFVSCGSLDSLNTVIKKGDGYYHRFFLQNDTLVGFLMVGNIKEVGILRQLVLTGESALKMLSEF